MSSVRFGLHGSIADSNMPDAPLAFFAPSRRISFIRSGVGYADTRLSVAGGTAIAGAFSVMGGAYAQGGMGGSGGAGYANGLMSISGGAGYANGLMSISGGAGAGGA